MEPQKELKVLDVSGEWELEDFGHNVLTLDTCDVYFDGKLVGEKENVPDVLYMALDLKRKVQVRCEYSFEALQISKECCLVCETPEKFKITVNGTEIDKKDIGYFVDHSFRKIPLDGMLKTGKNVISLEIYFAPEETIYEALEKACVFESEKNKLTFDTEFESTYIIGDFAVNTPGEFVQLEKNAVRYDGEFTLSEKPQKLYLQNIEQQGFPFFAGRITLRKDFDLSDVDYELKFDKKGINAVHVRVNDIDCGCIMWGHLRCDISHALKPGKNTVELVLVNNLRNMLGPHHLPSGESWHACPVDFYRRKNVWTNGYDMPWNDGYCLAEVSMK